jgi:hypothetical protein
MVAGPAAIRMLGSRQAAAMVVIRSSRRIRAYLSMALGIFVYSHPDQNSENKF